MNPQFRFHWNLLNKKHPTFLAREPKAAQRRSVVDVRILLFQPCTNRCEATFSWSKVSRRTSRASGFCIYLEVYMYIIIFVWWHVVKVVLCFISHCLARGVLMFCLSSLHLEWIWRASLVRLMDSTLLLLSAVEKDIMTIAISTTTSTATSSSSSSSTTTTKAATLTSSTTKAAASQWRHQHLQLDVYYFSARTHIQDMYIIVYIYIYIFIYALHVCKCCF